MQRGTSRKFAVIALGIMTLALVAVGVIILFQIQGGQEPGDADAFGFGSSAVTVNFIPVAEAMFATPCRFFLNEYNLDQTTSDKLNEIGNTISPVNEPTTPVDDNVAKFCGYSSTAVADEEVAISIRVNTYPEDAVIDDSAADLYNRVNPEYLADVSEPIELLNQVYFQGTSKANPNNCTAVLYHKQNDFEFALITLHGQPCSESGEYIGQVVEQVANLVEFVMAPFLVEGYYEYEIPESAILR